jgi:DNA-binding transcriptional ArsR family regulator
VLTLRFSAQDLARTRFACSPLWEVVNGVQVLKDPGRHGVHLGWARQTRRALAVGGIRTALLSELIPVPTPYVPDFLTPVPEVEEPSLEDELAVLMGTSAEELRTDLDRITGPLPPLVQRLRDAPDEGLARLAEEIRAYWSVAVEPHWPRIRRLMDGEILHRARMMARGGAAALFQDLHPAVSWDGGTLRVAHPGYEADRALEAGRGLVLVPSVFVWPGVFSQSNPPRQPGLVYPPRGVATLWERRTEPTPEGLAAALGRSRAQLLTELVAPASTSELALRLGMAPATVSHHLGVLRAAGLATAHRSGRIVLYLRTHAAEALVGAAPEAVRTEGTVEHS